MMIVGQSGKSVSTLDLFLRRCDCGEMNIYGFWWQLLSRGMVARNGLRLTVRMPCDKCGGEHYEPYEAVYTPEDCLEHGFDMIAMGM